MTMATIQLRTPVPGPKGKAILDRRAAAMPGGLGKSTEIVVERAEGAVIHDVDGNVFLDFAGGIGMVNAGHRPAGVVDAMKDQLDRYVHTCSLVTTPEPYVALAEVLNRITPGDFPKKTLLANSGAEAVENAVNIARYATRRPGVIVFEGGYHGRTLLTMSLTSKYSLFKKGFGPFASDIYRLPAPNLYRTAAGISPEQYLQFCIDNIDHAFVAQVDPESVAAILIEPVQGEAGFVPMPAPFLRKLRDVCTRHGIVLIADEIQSGFGRTGKLFAIEHSGVVPDMVTMAKSLGSGMPISAVTGRADLMDAPHLGGIGGTYGGSPVACAAALKTIEIINTPEFLGRATAIGEIVAARLEEWKQKFPAIGDVRGLGAMRLVEFVKDRTSKTPDPDLALRIIREGVANGLVLIRAGLFSNCIRLLPPIAMTDDQLQEGLGVLEAAIAKHAGA